MKLITLRNLIFFSTAFTAAFFTAQSQAAGDWYVGGAVTQAFVDENGLDEDDTGGQVYGGYQFNDYFSLQANYYDFGKIEEGNNQLDVEGFGIAAIGYLPISERFRLLGKIGIHDWDADRFGRVASQITDDSDTDAFYGVGLEYSFTDKLSLRTEVERYEVADFDVDAISVGLRYSF